MRPNFLDSMLYPVDPIADALLNKNIETGIKEVYSSGFWLLITFNNNSNAKLWNTNLYYAWLSSGWIDNYYYDQGRPTKKTMRKLIKAIKMSYLK